MIDEDEPIRVLSELQAPISTRWHDPDQLRHIARRRPRIRQAGIAGGLVLIGIIAAVVVPHGAQHRPTDSATGLQIDARSGSAIQLVANAKPLTTTDAQAEAAVARTEQAFALSLLRHASAGTQNVVLSPSSLAIALSMLQNGAAGTTRSEIAKTLQTTGLSLAQQNAGWATLATGLASSEDVMVESANSLWLQRNLKMRTEFMNALARYYNTGVWQVDFAHDLTGATSAINSWTKQHTGGKITKLFNPGDIDASTALVLANAVYFNAPWKVKLDPKQTTTGTFHAPGGATQAPFMTAPDAHSANTQDYESAVLPYAGGRFSAVLVMPKTQSLATFVAGMTPSELDTMARPQGQSDTVRLPKFTIASYTHLNSTLAAMGMPTAFTDAADFSAMSPTAMNVQTVAQRGYLQVDETGTKAAAVTGVGMQAMSGELPVVFDHPFLFLVRDTTTGAILFAAQIQHP
jgi:serpin B